MRNELIRGLGDIIPGANYERLNTFDQKRFAIPALRGYEKISVNRLQFGIAHPVFGTNWIIAPFTCDLAKKVFELPKEEFVDFMMSTQSFENVVEFVGAHGVFRERTSVAEIREVYRGLLEEYYETATDTKKE